MTKIGGLVIILLFSFLTITWAYENYTHYSAYTDGDTVVASIQEVHCNKKSGSKVTVEYKAKSYYIEIPGYKCRNLSKGDNINLLYSSVWDALYDRDTPLKWDIMGNLLMLLFTCYLIYFISKK